MRYLALLGLLFSSWVVFAQKPVEPKWLPALAVGAAPECPNRPGLREARSQAALDSKSKASAHITGSATHRGDGSCQQITRLVINESGQDRQIELQRVTRSEKELKRDPFDAPDPVRSYSIIDFSSNGASILLEREGTDDWHNETFRDVDLAILNTNEPTQPKWVNAWDLMHWDKCNATVDAQGFDSSGKPVLRVRPSVWQSKPRADCVAKPELWAVEFDRTHASHLPDETQIARNGEAIGVDWVTCKNDPDIAAACFRVQGRLAVYNGSPSLRIWRVGTNRILGVRTEITPENVSARFSDSDPFDTEIYGDYEVCPFTKEKPGEMQMVCIESASHLVAKQR